MLFNNQHKFKGQTITNVIDKPRLHKKGKRWIVLGASALMLAGLGVSATHTNAVHADSTNNSGNDTTANTNAKASTVKSANQTTNVMGQASNMHANLQAQMAKYQLGHQAKVNAQSGANQNASASNNVQASSVAPSKVSGSANQASSSSVNSVKASSNNTNLTINSGASSKAQPQIKVASNNDNGKQTFNLGNPTEQARGWNFVQHGIGNNDFAHPTSSASSSNNLAIQGINKSGASQVSNKASNNNAVNINSGSAKASVNNSNASAMPKVSNKVSASSLNSASASSASVSNNIKSVASANSIDSKSNTSAKANVKTLGSVHELGDANNIQTGTYDGLNYKYNSTNNSVEFTGGTAQSDLTGFISDAPSNIKNATSIKFDDINTSNVTNMSQMFEGDSDLQSLDLGSHFDTSNVNDMNNMFAGNSLTSVNLGNKFNTSNVTNMSCLFADGSSKIIQTMLPLLNTNKVTNMSSMFSDVSNLQSLDLGDNFNTQNVTNMSNMFGNNYSDLQSLDLGNSFDTSNVTNMSNMFGLDIHLQSLNLGNHFDTHSVTNMESMFDGDNKLTNLFLPSSFDTHNVSNMEYMFSDVSDLTKLTLPNSFDTSNVKNMSDMFGDDDKLREIDIGSPNTRFSKSSNVPKGASTPDKMLTTWYRLGNYTPSKGLSMMAIPTANLADGKSHVGDWGNAHLMSAPEQPKYSDIYGNSDGMTNPNSVNSDWAYVNAQGQVSSTPIQNNNGNNMVAPVYKGLTYHYNKSNNSVDFVSGTANSDLNEFLRYAPSDIKNANSITFGNNIDTSHVNNMNGMLGHDSSLNSLVLGNSFNTTNVNNMNAMFIRDTNLKSLTLPNSFNTSNVKNMRAMFVRDSDLTSLTLPNNFDTSNVNNMKAMFAYDNSLKSLTIQSPNTKFNNTIRLQPMYKQDSDGDGYTASDANDFSKGIVGTFVTTKNTKPKNLTMNEDHDLVAFFTKDADGNYDNQVGNVITVSGNANSSYTIQSNQLPSDTKLANDGSQTFNLNNGEHVIDVDDTKPNNNSDDIPVTDKSVTFNGTIALNFRNNQGTMKVIYLPYSINSKISYKLKDLLNSTNPSATVPADYLNKVINEYNTANYHYNDDNGVKQGDYDNVYIDPTNSGKYDSANNTYNNGTITLDFDANQMPENIHYNYNGGTDNAGKGTISGDNDATGDITSDVASNNGLDPGWHLANKDNNFTFGNGGSDASGQYSDNENVPVLPNKANATIQFQVSDNSSNSTNNGDNLNTITPSGNDYRTNSVAGDGTYQIKGTDIPNGYHLVSGQNSDINYDNNTHVMKIVGNNHNPSDKGTITPSNVNPSTLPKTDPNYVPASDVVTVHSKEYDNGQYIKTQTQYIAESGKTGESYTVSPYNFIPDGYQVEKTDSANVNGVFTPNGVSVPDITFDYDAKEGTAIDVDYINQNGQIVETGKITGDVDDRGNAYSQVGMPKGYHFVRATNNGKTIPNASATDIPYHILPNDSGSQDIQVTVSGNQINGKPSDINDNHPTVPSDTPKTPTQPSDMSDTNVNPNQPSDNDHPSDNPVVPSHNGQPNPTDTTPNGKNTTGNKPYSNPSDLTPAHPDQTNSTFYVVINDFGYNRTDGKYDKLERQYVKRLTPQGQVGNKFHISPDTYVTNGYNEDTTGNKAYTGYFGANGLLASDDKTSQDSVVWNYDADVQHAKIHYTNQDGTDVTPSNNTISGHTDSDINPTDQSDGGVPVPTGYHIAPNTNPNYHFNNPTNNPNNNPDATYKVQGNEIKGTATVHLIYKESNGKTDSTRDVQIPLDARVGDNAKSVLAFAYGKNGYQLNTNVWNIPFTANIAPNGDNLNYNPTHTFTYVGEDAGNVEVRYRDVDPQSANYNQIVGTQDLGNLGTVNQVVELGQTDGGDPKTDSSNGDNIDDVLNTPTGYVLVHHINPITIQLHHGLMLLTLSMKPLKSVVPNFNPNKPVSAKYGQITVNYVDGSNKVLDTITTDGKDGASFDKVGYQNVSIPNYHLANVVNGDINYNATPQTVTMVEAHDATPTPQIQTDTKTNTVYVPKIVDVPTNTTTDLQPVVHNIYHNTTTTNSDSQAINGLKDQLAKDQSEINNLVIAENEAKANNNNFIPKRFTHITINPKTDKLIKIDNDNQLVGMKVGQIANYHGLRVARVANFSHYRYFKVYKTVLLHSTFFSVGSLKHVHGVFTPRMRKTIHIKGIYRVGKGKHAEFRYLINYKHHNYFVTGNPKFTRNAYLQDGVDYSGRKFVVTNHTVLEHEHVDGKAVKKLHRGQVLTIKRIKNISKHPKNMMTRIQLSNGLWVTANKNFIHLI